jgi:geranylgeranyl diphosphate synthase, type I
LKLDQAFDQYLPIIERDLKHTLDGVPPMLQSFYGMMGYHLGWLDESLSPVVSKIGKRLRPFLCLMTCQAVGGDPTSALPAGSALELIHNFSLVHDDIQDNSQYRRHRKAVWTVWGAPHAINAGDGLFALAFLQLSQLGGRVSPDRVEAVFEDCSRACLLLCEGQYMDMSFEKRSEVSEDEYLQMIARKTGALLSCAAHVGAIIGCHDEALVQKYQHFGASLGLAFQVQDDILGIWGDPKVTGKSAADDILQCKKTLPVLYALRREAELGRDFLHNLYRVGSVCPSDLPRVLDALSDVGALEYAEQVNGRYCDQALAQLEATGSDPDKLALLSDLVERLRERPS